MHALSSKKLIVLALVLAVIAILVMALSRPFMNQNAQSQPVIQTATNVQTMIDPPPPPGSAIDPAQNAAAFQFLVSYTNSGFEPQIVTVKAGDTVRFTNNSTKPVWVASLASTSASLYPGSSTCGGSAFDSCGGLHPSDYWQFTFTQKGTWEFQNQLDKSKTAMITVQ